MNLFLLKVGYQIGLISHDDIIKWSDQKVIDNCDEDYVFDLSLSSGLTKAEILAILDRASKDTSFTSDNFDLILIYLENKLSKKLFTWEEVQMFMVKMKSLKNVTQDDDDYEFWIRIEDDFYLRKEGFNGCMDMPYELNNFLETYQRKDTSEVCNLICLLKSQNV